MFDFRYHLISLVAVFLALGIGILLGVTIADTGVVSSAQKNLERSLRDDLHQARAGEADVKADLARRNAFEEQIYPNLVAGLLSGRRIGLVAMGALPSGITSDVRDSLLPTGGRLSSISVVAIPLDVDGLAGALAKTRYADLNVNSNTLGEFAGAAGRQLVRQGSVPKRVKGSLLTSRSGADRPLDGVIYARDRRELKGDDNAAANRFESAFVKGMSDEGVPVVGVEEEGADPSQIGYFSDRGLTTVDDVDLAAGRVSLIYALLGAKGNYGSKRTADQLLPQTFSAPPQGR